MVKTALAEEEEAMNQPRLDKIKFSGGRTGHAEEPGTARGLKDKGLGLTIVMPKLRNTRSKTPELAANPMS